MLVWAGGQDGTIGGGKLEFTSRRPGAPHAGRRRRLALSRTIRSGPLLGQCCGGNVGLLLERLDGDSAGWLADIAAAEAAASPIVSFRNSAPALSPNRSPKRHPAKTP